MFLFLLSCLKTPIIKTALENTPAQSQTEFEDIEITRLAFGSCYEPMVEEVVLQHNQTSIWEGITEFSPQVFLMLGDNFYTDVSMENGYPKETYIPANALFLKEQSLSTFTNAFPLDLSLYEAGYNRVLGQKSFQQFLQQNPSVRLAALWDDHDFCSNDCFGEGEFNLSGRITEEAKLESQKQFLNFLQQSNPDASFLAYKDSQKQWSDSTQGIYSTYLFGKEKRKIRVILLDTRFHQNPTKGALLGEKQWRWLENILGQDDGAVFTIIASSIQYFPDLQGGPARRKIGTKFGESWGQSVKTTFATEEQSLVKTTFEADFRAERERLMALVAKSKRNGVIFLSGDKHIGAIDYLTTKEQANRISEENPLSIGYPVYDITSSGLSHSFSTVHKGAHVGVANWLYKTAVTTQRHFGAIEIDWSDDKNPSLTISLRTEKNDIALTKDWRYNFSEREYSGADRFVLRGVGGRYLFKSPKPLSIRLSLSDLSPQD